MALEQKNIIMAKLIIKVARKTWAWDGDNLRMENWIISPTAVTWIFRVPDPSKPDKHTIANIVTDRANTEHHTGSPYAYLSVGPAIGQEANMVYIMVVQVGILSLYPTAVLLL